MDEGLLSDEQKKKLQNLDLHVIKAANLKITTCYDTIIAALKSHDWYRQNPAIELISSNGENEIAALLPAKQEELGRNILQAADGESSSAWTYLLTVRRDLSSLEKPFLKGLIFEAFVNEKLEFRFKIKYMTMVLDLLTKRQDIEVELIVAIDASKRKGMVFKSDYCSILKWIKERPDIKLLAEALERNSKKLLNA